MISGGESCWVSVNAPVLSLKCLGVMSRELGRSAAQELGKYRPTGGLHKPLRGGLDSAEPKGIPTSMVTQKRWN